MNTKKIIYIIGSKNNNIKHIKKYIKFNDIKYDEEYCLMNLNIFNKEILNLRKIKLYVNTHIYKLLLTFINNNEDIEKTLIEYESYLYLQNLSIEYTEVMKQFLKLFIKYKCEIELYSFKGQELHHNEKLTNCINNIEPNKDYYNIFLKKIKCPYQYSNEILMGTHVVLNYVIDNEKKINKNSIKLINFTVNDKYLGAYYQPKFVNNINHEYNIDIKIINWLHINNYIDASLCFIKNYNLINN